MYYKMLISWTSQKVKDTYTTRNAFDFKNVCGFERSMINAPGPCVLFATPGMISGGFSMEVFKQWAPSELNLVALPGYCVAGTIGHKLMSGKPTKIGLDKDSHIDVRCQIHQVSFSPHTDSKGIMDLVKFLSPKHVILVHGEKPNMASLKARIQSELGIQCYDPANNDTVSVPSMHNVKADASATFIRSSLNPNFKFQKCCSEGSGSPDSQDDTKPATLVVCDERVAEGILVIERNQKPKVVHQDELLHVLGEEKHEIQFAYCCPVHVSNKNKDQYSGGDANPISYKLHWLHQLFEKICNDLTDVTVHNFEEYLQVESLHVSVCSKDNCPYRHTGSSNVKAEAIFFCCMWSVQDEKLAWRVVSFMKNAVLSTS